MVHCVHPFNGPFSRTTWVSRHQKGKPFWILMKQEMMGWQWHQLHHMQIVCTSPQTDNHASTSPLSVYRPDALPVAQPTASRHWGYIFQTSRDGNFAPSPQKNEPHKSATRRHPVTENAENSDDQSTAPDPRLSG